MPDQRSRARRALVGGLSAGRARPDQLRGGNHGLTREQVVASQRERVLAAMREAVAERGFRAVPVADAIARAGVSRKTFYELYATKEECFAAVYEREMELLTGPVLAAFAGREPWVDRLRTALGVLLGALAGDPGAARICFVEVLTAGPLGLERRNAAMGALAPLFDPAGAGRRGDRDTSSDADGAAPPPASVVPISIGYLFETLNREIAAGRTAELPALREQLMRTLTLPFGERAGDEPPQDDPAPDDRRARDDRRAPDDRGDPDHRRAPGDAGPRGGAPEGPFLTAYGAAAAELLGRVAGALADAAETAPPDGRTDSDAERAERQLHAGVAAVLDFCAERPDRARAWLVEALTAGPAARERRSETGHRLSDLFEQPLRALRPSEHIARISAIALVGGLHELLFDPVDRSAPTDLPPIEAILTAAGLDPRAP